MTYCNYLRGFSMSKQLLSLMLCLSMGYSIQAMDYPPAPFVDITTVNPYEIDELDGILDNAILQKAERGAVSGATGALTNSLIMSGALFMASRDKGGVNIHQIPLDIASATLQGAVSGYQSGLQEGIVDEIAYNAPASRQELVKAMLQDGMEGVTAGIGIAHESNDNVLKCAVIGGACGTLSGAAKVATRNVIVKRIAEESPLASVVNGTSEASINYARNKAIRTSIECTKDVSCVIS